MKFLVTVFSVFVFSFCFSQTQISGKLIDIKGEPLFGVNVSTDRMEGSVTDFDGNYTLDVEPGSFTLSLSSIGYVLQKHDVVIQENQKITLNYTLLEEKIEVDDVIVYGNKRGRRLQEEVQSVEVVKAEFLENNNVTDGLQAVNLLSGVTVLDGQMSVRGGSGYAYGVGSRVILVQDEVPVLTPERDEINWDFIATENIEQLELLKGGGAVQYGSSALNGILSVRSAWAKKKQETEISIYNTFIGKPKVKGANWWKDEPNYFNIPHALGMTFVHKRKMKNNVDLTFSGMAHSFQSHLKDEFNERLRFNFNIRHRSKKINGLTFGLYSMYMYKNDSFFFIWEGNEDKKYLPLATYGKRYHYSMLHPFISYYDEKGNTFKYNGSVYYDVMARMNSGNNSTKAYNDFQYQKKFKFGLGFIAGFTMENKFIQAPALRDIYFPDDVNGTFTFSNYSVYLLGDYKINKLNLSVGARYEIISFLQQTVSAKPVFSFGTNYELSKNDFMRFSINQSYRIPNVAERFVDESLGPINIYPNPEIMPETGYTAEIGYKRMLNNKKWKGFIDFAIYWTEFDNMVEFNFGDHSEPEDTVIKLGFKAENVARARIFGWELNIEERVQLGKFELAGKFGYTYAYGVDLNANKRNKNIGTFLGNAFSGIAVSNQKHIEFERNPSGFLPGNPLFGTLKYRFRHTLKLDLSAKFQRIRLGANMAYYSYMDNVDAVFQVFIPGVAEDRAELNFKGDFILNLRAMYEVEDKVTFGFIVKNIFNNDYAIRPAKPNAPRSFTFQTKFKF